MIEYVLWTAAFISLFLTIVWINIMYLQPNAKKQAAKAMPLVTIAVPAHNEEKTIEATLESLTGLNYPKNKIEIIIIEDGSKDRTLAKIKKFMRENKDITIKLIAKTKNEGKAEALNSALKITKGDFFACVDSDTTVDPNSLRNMMYRFKNKKTAAVISTIKVKNPDNLYGKIQRMEYLMAVFMRNLMTITKTLHVTPGALSVYRTGILKKTGGFDPKNLTEDFEIAMRLKSLKYNIELEKTSIVYTNVPITTNSFWRQRIRWSRGFIANNIKYKHMVFNKKYGVMGTFQLPLNIIAPFLLIISSIVIMLLLVANLYETALRSIMINGYLQTKLTSLPTLKELILSQNMKIVFPLLIGSILGIYVFYMAHKLTNEKIRGTGSTIFYFFAMPYMIASYWVAAAVQEAAKMKKRW